MHQTLFLNKALNQFKVKAHACIVIESEEIQQAWDSHWIVHDPKTTTQLTNIAGSAGENQC